MRLAFACSHLSRGGRKVGEAAAARMRRGARRIIAAQLAQVPSARGLAFAREGRAVAVHPWRAWLPTFSSPSPRAPQISSSALLRADGDSEDMALQWSVSFDNKLKMLMMEAGALERELCENPPPERQAVIGKTLARSARARALGGELLGWYDELRGLMEVVEDHKEDASTREAFRAESVVAQERIKYLQAELIVELLPRDLDDELGVVLEVRAAAGGSEASLFAGEVFEMYQKYCYRKGWKFEVMSTSPSGLLLQHVS